MGWGRGGGRMGWGRGGGRVMRHTYHAKISHFTHSDGFVLTGQLGSIEDKAIGLAGVQVLHGQWEFTLVWFL